MYVADTCHLCAAALEVIATVRADTPFELAVVDISANEELEGRYRTDIPVVEIDGVRAFTYHVTAEGLRAALL